MAQKGGRSVKKALMALSGSSQSALGKKSRPAENRARKGPKVTRRKAGRCTEKKLASEFDQRLDQVQRFSIVVQTWTGKTMVLNVQGSDTIENVKEMLRTLEGTPEERQILMVDGQELQDHHTISHNNLRDESSLDQRCKRYLIDIDV